MLTPHQRLTQHHRLILGLIGVSAIWGLTFPLVQDAVAEVPVMRFLALRYAIATAVLGLLVRRIDRRTLRAGLILGVILFGGYVAQTLALRTSSSTNVSFITAMYVVLTPLIGSIIVRRSPGWSAISGVVLATAGLVFLASPSGPALARRDAFALACAALFAAHIIGIGLVTQAADGQGVDPLGLTAVQTAVAAVLSLTTSLVTEPGPWAMPSRASIGTLLLTGVGASALALVVQTRAQRVLALTPVAVILTMESVFGGFFSYLIAGDRLDAGGYLGAALIMTGVLVASTRTPEGDRKCSSGTPRP